MQTARILQAVVLMMIVAMAASCASGKEYTNRLFSKRPVLVKDSQLTVFRFLDTDSTETDKEGWVSADFLMGRDTLSSSNSTDNFSKVANVKIDSIGKKSEQTTPKMIPVAKNNNPGEVRNKRTRNTP